MNPREKPTFHGDSTEPAKLTRKYIKGKTIADCNKCGKAWEILQKAS